jgi:elongation factor G
LQEALDKLSREDPSLRWSKDERTDTFILSGMGALHLEIARDHLKTNYKINALWGGIRVDFKECVTVPTGAHHYLYDRVVANKSGKAGCTASLEPLEAHHRESLMTSSVERDGNIYQIQIPMSRDVELQFDPELVRQQLFNGACAALARGPRRGSPVHSCRVGIVFDPETDYFGAGTDGHIVNAAYHAVRNALNEAQSNNAVGILEPVMLVNIACPEDSAGAVQHDISSARGGQVMEIKDPNAGSTEGTIDLSEVYVPPDPYETRQSLRDGKKGATRMLEIVAKVPLAEMLDYDSHLRSKTSGRHSLTMSLDTFERVRGPREKNLPQY